MDRLTAMEAFVAVAETGSFTRAARHMRISTPMVTLHVRRLEEHLGATLFNWTTRRVDLTEDGRQLLAYARTALDAFAHAETALRQENGLTGRVRLDLPASIGQTFVVPALTEFHRMFPNITLDLSLGDRGTFFRTDGFDLVIRAGNVSTTGWRAVPLGTTRLICLASPDYIERHGRPMSPEDLNHHRCILYASVEAPGGDPWRFMHKGQKVRVRLRPAFTFNDGTAIMAATRAGLGISCNLEMLVRGDLRAGALVPILPEYNEAPLSVVLMSAQERSSLPHVRAVRDFLIQHIDWQIDAG